MARRFIVLLSLLAWAGISVLAAERATFILTSGERKSGAVVFHGENRENLIDNHLNLSDDSTGREQTYTVDQVAVIDFVGGRPSATELNALPVNNGTHLLTLKNGTTQLGTFVNMIGGDTVRWRDRNSQQHEYAIRDVTRIYLNAQSARIAFDVPIPASTGAVATAGLAASRRVEVPARIPWTTTGITVRAGDRVAFRASGQVGWGPNPSEVSGPEGEARVQQTVYPVPGRPVGTLIAMVQGGAPFEIGVNTEPIVMPSDGRLLLGVNDNLLNDNSGAFLVVITPMGR